MNVLLINPPHKNVVGVEVPAFIREHEGVFPPLGLMYIASYLKSRTDYQVRMLDMAAEGMDSSAIQGYLRSDLPDIVGITTHTHNLRDVVSLTRYIKDVRHTIHVCLGGPQATLFPRETMALPCVDSAVAAGEGEAAFTELVRCLREKGDLNRVQGIFFKKDSRVFETGRRDVPADLNGLPFPDRSLLPLRRYQSILGNASMMATVMSSRGCPFRCSFCSTPRGPFRARSPENIVDEIEACRSLGIGEIHFVDDTFNADPERVIRICDELQRRNIRVRWSFRGRVNGVTEAMLLKARAAGCYRIHLGVETASETGLAQLNKDITLEQVRAVFQWARTAGISIVAYFLIGCPHEKSPEDVMKTVSFACQLDPDFALFNILTAYPGTELFDQGVRKGVFASDCWKKFVLSPEADFRPVLWEEYMDREQLVSLLNFAYRRFYLRPSCMARTLCASGNIRGLVKKVRAGMALCRVCSK